MLHSVSLISCITNGRYSFSLQRTIFAPESGGNKGMPLEKQLGAVISEGHRTVTETYEGETTVAAVAGLMGRARALQEADRSS